MSLPIERSRARRPITWLTLAGVLLLPVVIGGLLVSALYNPVERLGNMSAAIVNDDEPVEIGGQLAPLGRQLTAGLVEGSDAVPSNIDWTISNDEDAAAGLADGTYSAVITIPENFSAAATSTAPGATPERATISVQSAPDGRVVDEAITAQITQTAASVFGTEVSKQYLTSVLLGFTTLHDQLGEAASGARQLSEGGATAAEGAAQLSGGVTRIADGAGALAGGASQLAAGASTASSGLQQWAGGAGALAGGTTQIADALDAIAQQVPSDMPQVPVQVIDAAREVGANSAEITQALTATVTRLDELAASCDPAVTPELCAALTDAAAQARAALPAATGIVDQADQIADGLEGINQLPQLGQGLTALAGETRQVATGMQGLAAGATQASDGVAQLAAGAGTLSGGASQLSSGATEAANGAASLADGVGQLATGSATLADGLDTAVDQVPTYTDDEAQRTASVVADPVAAEGIGANLFGTAAIPLLTALVLWFGGLGSFVAFQAVSARALTSRRPSAVLVLRAFAPGAILGAVQGLLVAGVVQVAATYDWAEWSLFAAVCVLAGVAFAAVNQALVALFGGTGRWISAVIGAFAVATGIVSTVPGALTAIGALLPVEPASAAMLGALTSSGGVTAGVVALVVWALLSLATTTVVLSRRRTVSARAALAPLH